MKTMRFKWIVMVNAIIALTVILSANVSATATDVSNAIELATALANPAVTQINLVDNIEVAGDVSVPIVGTTKTISSAGNFDLTLGGALTIPTGVAVEINLNDFIVNHSTGNSILTVNGTLTNKGTITSNTTFGIEGTGGTFSNEGTINMNNGFTIASTITNTSTGIINITGDSGLTRQITAPIANEGKVYVATGGTISLGSNTEYVTGTGVNLTINPVDKSTTVSTLAQLQAALAYGANLTNITLGADITVENESLNIPAGITVTVPSNVNFTNNVGVANRFDNYGTIIGVITNNTELKNMNLIIGEVLGNVPDTMTSEGIVITNGDSVDVYSGNQLAKALANNTVKNIELRYYAENSLRLLNREDVIFTIPDENNGINTSSFYIEVHNYEIFENRGTIIVESPNGLDLDKPTSSGTGTIYNSGTITTRGVGSIRGGTPYSRNTANPTFNIADGPIEFREYNGENYFAIGVDNKLFTRYTGTATITGTSTGDTNIVTVSSGTHNINFSNLSITTSAGAVEPFEVTGAATVNINLIGLNTLTASQVGMLANATGSKLNITSSTGGRLISSGTDTVSSTGIIAESVLINGNADVTANGNGDGAGIASGSITIGGTARVTAIHLSTTGVGIASTAFSSKPILSLDAGHTATVRAGAAAPGTLIANHATTDYHQNIFAQVQISPPVATTTTVVPTSPNTGAYIN